MSWHYLPVEAVEYGQACCSDTLPSALSRSLKQTGECSCSASLTEYSRASRSGTTCAHSTGTNGAERSTSSQAASPARTSAAPAKDPASMASAPDSGQKWRASLARYDPATRSLKTAQCLLFEGLTECSVILPRWGSMRSGECSERPPLVPHSTESVSGYWQTPTTRDAKGQSGRGNRIRRGRNGKLHVANLCDQIVDLGRPDLVRSVKFRLMLMGWPEEATSFEPLEMAKFQLWLKQHGVF